MAPTLKKRSIPIAVAAFLKRVLRRTVGMEPSSQYGENIAQRSKQLLDGLSLDEGSLAFKIALEELRREFDLLDEEAALIPEGLELQKKVVELAGRYEIADVLVRDMLTKPPVVRLFSCILVDAAKAGASQIKFDFLPDQEGFSVQLWVGLVWTDMMNLPTVLELPLRGVIARVEGLGYEAACPRFQTPMPQNLEFRWRDRQQLVIHLSLD